MNPAMAMAFRDELQKIAMVKVPGSQSVVGAALGLVPNRVLKVGLPVALIGVGATTGGVAAIANPHDHNGPRYNPDAFPVLSEDLR